MYGELLLMFVLVLWFVYVRKDLPLGNLYAPLLFLYLLYEMRMYFGCSNFRLGVKRLLTIYRAGRRGPAVAQQFARRTDINSQCRYFLLEHTASAYLDNQRYLSVQLVSSLHLPTPTAP